MSTEQHGQPVATYQSWNEALSEVLLPELPPGYAGEPVLLACDDDAVLAAAELLGVDAEGAAARFAQTVEARYSIVATAGLEPTHRDAVRFRTRSDRTGTVPPFLGVCALMVLAASRMTVGEGMSTGNYYGRLWETLGSRPFRRPPYHFDHARWLFRYLAQWLDEDLAGARGHLLLAEGGPALIGCAINQTVFRQRDKEHLAQFFADRVRGDAGYLDLLRLLQLSTHHHYLTHRANEVISDPELAPIARAALKRTYDRWDGTVPDVHGGRSWPGVLHLSVNRGLRLSLSAPARAPANLDFGVGGSDRVTVPLDQLGTLADRGVRYGSPGQPGVFLPAAGDTLLFEVREDSGLVWVPAPTQSHVYVLSRERELQRTLTDHVSAIRGTAGLPAHFRLYERVPAGRLPEELRERASSRARAPVTLSGGLRIGHGYLTGHPPRLEAGEVEQAMNVVVGAEHAGELSSGSELTLDLEAGDHRVAIGDGLVSLRIHMLDRNPARAPYGQLACSLDARGARAGASRDAPEPRVCGAALSASYDGPLPVLSRARAVALIDNRGNLVTQHATAPAHWLAAVGLDPRAARWEVELPDDAAWVLMSRSAVMVKPLIPALERTAAEAVLALPEHVRVRSVDPNARDAAARLFEELRARAVSEAGE